MPSHKLRIRSLVEISKSLVHNYSAINLAMGGLPGFGPATDGLSLLLNNLYGSFPANVTDVTSTLTSKPFKVPEVLHTKYVVGS